MKSYMQKLANESKKTQKINHCGKVVSLGVPPQGCEEKWNAAASQWEHQNPENQPIRDQEFW